MTDSFSERVEWVLKRRGISGEQWARDAGLSPRYIATTLFRARANPAYLPEYKTLQKLADAGRVRFQWLAEGEGEAEYPPGAAPPGPMPERVVVGQHSPAVRALLLAYRAGEYDPEDVLALLDVLRGGEAMLSDGDEATATAVMAAWLRAVHRLRAAGHPVTFGRIAWQVSAGTERADESITARTVALNAEAKEELRGLGGEPPAEPVRPKKVR